MNEEPVRYLPTAVWALPSGQRFVARRRPALSDRTAADRICAALFSYPAHLRDSVVVVEAGRKEWRFEPDGEFTADSGIPDGTPVTPESAEAVVVVVDLDFDLEFDLTAFPDK